MRPQYILNTRYRYRYALVESTFRDAAEQERTARFDSVPFRFTALDGEKAGTIAVGDKVKLKYLPLEPSKVMLIVGDNDLWAHGKVL
jgi:hypothetical protein